MFEIGSQIVICLIVAALIGGVIGYLIGQAGCAKKSHCNESTEGTHELHIDQQDTERIIVSEIIEDLPKEEEEVGKKPTTLLSEAREGEKDNLQLIKGVGKILEKLLNDTGIYHLDQLANLTKEEIIWLNNSIATFPGKIEREKWVSQAKELVENSN